MEQNTTSSYGGKIPQELLRLDGLSPLSRIGMYKVMDAAPTTRLIRQLNCKMAGGRVTRLDIWYATDEGERSFIIMNEPAKHEFWHPSLDFERAVNAIRKYITAINPDAQFVDMSEKEDRKRMRK